MDETSGNPGPEQMQNPDDPFKTLGLAPDATLQEVRAAYESSVLTCYGEYSRGDLEGVRGRLRRLHEAYVAVLMTAASGRRSERSPLGPPDLALIELARLEARAVQGDGAEERVLGDRPRPPPVGAEAPGSAGAADRPPEAGPAEQPGLGMEAKAPPGVFQGSTPGWAWFHVGGFSTYRIGLVVTRSTSIWQS